MLNKPFRTTEAVEGTESILLKDWAAYFHISGPAESPQEDFSASVSVDVCLGRQRWYQIQQLSNNERTQEKDGTFFPEKNISMEMNQKSSLLGGTESQNTVVE